MLVFTLFIVRKNRIDKNKFIKNSRNLIASSFIEADKQLCIKIDSIVELWAAKGYSFPPGIMFSDITDTYLNEVSIRFEVIWGILLRTIKANHLVITTNLFKKILDNEVSSFYTVLEKYFYKTISMHTNNETQLKAINKENQLKHEMDRLLKKYEAEVSLLFDDKIFIHNHIL